MRKLSLFEFINQFGEQCQRVVNSCTNAVQLASAENYVRNGIKAYCNYSEGEHVEFFIQLLMNPKINLKVDLPKND